jgi:tetratricopeptide (TPR) repeat protein
MSANLYAQQSIQRIMFSFIETQWAKKGLARAYTSTNIPFKDSGIHAVVAEWPKIGVSRTCGGSGFDPKFGRAGQCNGQPRCRLPVVTQAVLCLGPRASQRFAPSSNHSATKAFHSKNHTPTLVRKASPMKNSFSLALLTLVSLQATVRAQIPESASEASAIQEALSLSRRGEYRQALHSYQQLLGSVPVITNIELRAYVLSRMADSDIELGEYSEAERRSGEALSILTSAGKRRTNTFAIAEGVRASALRAQGNYKEAKAAAERALVVAKETIDPRQPRFAILLTTLAQVLQETGNLRRAAALCRWAVVIFEDAKDTSPIDLGSAYQNLAVVYAQQGNAKLALDTVNHALATWKPAVPSDFPFIVYALATKILVYQELRAYQEAEDLIPEMLELGISRFGLDHPARLALLNTAAAVYVAEKKYEQAEPLLREGADVGRRCLPVGHPLLSNVLQNYSYVLAKLNRNDEASRARAESGAMLVFPRK